MPQYSSLKTRGNQLPSVSSFMDSFRSQAQLTAEQRPYRPYGACEQLFYCKDRLVGIDGPAGTGKSRGALEKVHLCMEKYYGARAMILRKTRESLSESALFTFEEHVVPKSHPIIRGEQRRNYRQSYSYPNGSEIIVGGLDKPQKLMSTEVDIIYIQEALECEESDIELVSTRLRNGKMPYQQLIFDCNPGPPTHWIWQRYQAQTLTLLHSRHEDNPTLYDQNIKQYTEKGLSYLAQLDELTGARKERLRFGRWVQAEGVVYDGWNTDIHVKSVEELAARGILYQQYNGLYVFNPASVKEIWGGVDWGFTNPGVLLVVGFDHDDCAYVLRQIYQTDKTIEWWVSQAQRLQQLYKVERWYADPSEPAYIRQFQRSGLITRKGVNDVAPGISAVQQRLTVKANDRPGLIIVQGSRHELDKDQALALRFKPTCIEDEFESYVWATSADGKPVKEVPLKVNDHALDGLRYPIAQRDLMRPRVGRIA